MENKIIKEIKELDSKEEQKSNLSKTDQDQDAVETIIKKIFKEYGFSTSEAESFDEDVFYFRTQHNAFARKGLSKIPSHYMLMDSGMPWFPYWILNIIEMTKVDYELSHDNKIQICQFLKELIDPDGGFKGTTKGLPHIVATYGAVMAIVNLGIKEAYDLIDIPKMKEFLLRMKNNHFNIDQPPSYVDKKGTFVITREKVDQCSTYSTTYPGAFSGHYNGESDLRATYCAIVIATILDIVDEDLTKGIVDNIKNCQTFEGGFAPEPFCEAHGGYSFCAIATLLMLDKLHEIDLKSFLRWLVNRQCTVEGGFNGRTNKLVDSCYSFWQGSIFNMLYMGDKTFSYDQELLYDQLSLQAYIMFCCQNPNGGLIDKPGRSPDFFHTNYATAGLICSQECMIDKCKISLTYDENNNFKDLNPIYCAPAIRVRKAKKYYEGLHKPQAENK